MGIRLRRSTVLIALATAVAAVIFGSVFRARGLSHGSARLAGSSSPPVVIVSQPTSPVQILSVTAVTPEPPQGVRPEVVADLKAYNVVLKNVTGHDVIVCALQLTPPEAAQDAAPRGIKSTAWFTKGPGEPALSAGQTKSDVVSLIWRGGELAFRVDVVALDDGTVYGKNMSRAFNEYVENIDTRQAVMRGILSTLQAQGPQETERLLKDQLAYLDSQLATFTSPDWVN